MKVIRCSGVQGGGVYRLIFVSFRMWGVSKTGALAAVWVAVFNNGPIMILLEHKAAHFPRAAEQFASNGLKTDRKSLSGKELNW